jgi:signal transduction histidine kinase
MAESSFKLSVLVIASILLIMPGTNLLSQTIDAKQVLILNAYDSNAAPYESPKEIFKAELQRKFGEPIVFHEVNLDARGGQSDARDNLIAELLRNHYADTRPDFVLSLGGPAGARFWLGQKESIFGQAPLIAFAWSGLPSPEDQRPGDIMRLLQFSFSGAVDDILRLRPRTSHVLVVFGSSSAERALTVAVKKELAAYSKRLSFEYTNDMTLHELRVTLEELSEDSAVFYGIFNVDAAGVISPHEAGLAAMRSISPVPIFGIFDDQVGQGVVGGRLIPVQQSGLEAAALGLAILRGESIRDARKPVEMSTPVYDWRELKRWGIDFQRLPAGSEIRHRPPSLWDQYTAWIVLVSTVVTVQGLLLIALLKQRRQRRSAELAQIKLSGQLINAYEDERRVIARELHDDLTQRLARLAIDAGVISHDQNRDTLDDELKNLRDELASVSEDVHDMSYRLHPSIVEDLGISTALRAECQRMQKYTEIRIKEHIGETHGKLPKNLALCAYRVCQEALNNAVRHATADNIEVVLEDDGQSLKLEVSDDGQGFEKAKIASGNSIGLSSMRERIRLLGGTLSIRSKLGEGTSVSAVLPLTGDNP